MPDLTPEQEAEGIEDEIVSRFCDSGQFSPKTKARIARAISAERNWEKLKKRIGSMFDPMCGDVRFNEALTCVLDVMESMK